MTKVFVPVVGHPTTPKEWLSFGVLIVLAMTGLHGLVVAFVLGVVETPWNRRPAP